MRLDLTDQNRPTAAQIINWTSENNLEKMFRQVISNYSYFYI